MRMRCRQMIGPTARFACIVGSVLLAGWVVVLTGCQPGESPPNDGTAHRLPLSGLRVRVVVVGDPGLSDGIEPLQGEWMAQSESKFSVTELSEDHLEEAVKEADALIFPSYRLGVLAEGRHAVALPRQDLHQQGHQWQDIFELERLGEVTWGSTTLAVPFGSPVLVCYYRADLLKKHGRKPPETWTEYQQLATLLHDRKNLGELAPPADSPWCGAIEPLGEGWRGLLLLARAAPYAKHPDNYSTLFDIHTMEPLVSGPPFERALAELVAATKFGPRHPLSYSPQTVREAFWQGDCGLALTWPTACARLQKIYSEQVVPGLAELPGSAEVYNVGERAWETRPEDSDGRVTLLAVRGRLGVVTARSRQPEAAAQLLLWLSGTLWSRPPSTQSPDTTLYRRSQMRSPELWVESVMPPATAAQYAEVVEKSLSRSQWLFALRIPGRAEYLEALDTAVGQAVRGEKSPQEALKEAADRWRAITRRLGLQKQRQAYQRSLGVESYSGR